MLRLDLTRPPTTRSPDAGDARSIEPTSGARALERLATERIALADDRGSGRPGAGLADLVPVGGRRGPVCSWDRAPRNGNIETNPLVAFNLNTDAEGGDVVTMAGDGPGRRGPPSADQHATYLPKYARHDRRLRLDARVVRRSKYAVAIRITPDALARSADGSDQRRDERRRARRAVGRHGQVVDRPIDLVGDRGGDGIGVRRRVVHPSTRAVAGPVDGATWRFCSKWSASGKYRNGRRAAASSIVVVSPPWTTARSQAARCRYRSGTNGRTSTPAGAPERRRIDARPGDGDHAQAGDRPARRRIGIDDPAEQRLADARSRRP